jgi:hypothetical protein
VTLVNRTSHTTFVLAFAALVLAFAALYPYLDTAGSCGDPGCPEFSNAQAPADAAMLAALLAAVSVAPVLARGLGCRSSSDRKPAEIHLPPEPGPPRR